MKYLKTYELSKNINKHKGLYIDTVRNNHTSIFNAFKKYLDNRNLTFKVVSDEEGSLAKMFNISIFPTTIIYDKDRAIFYSDVGYTSTFGLWIRMWLAK